MKTLVILLLPYFLIGCSTCSDGEGTNWFGMLGSTYRACMMGCTKGTKKCGCTSRCPCWREAHHGAR